MGISLWHQDPCSQKNQTWLVHLYPAPFRDRCCFEVGTEKWAGVWDRLSSAGKVVMEMASLFPIHVRMETTVQPKRLVDRSAFLRTWPVEHAPYLSHGCNPLRLSSMSHCHLYSFGSSFPPLSATQSKRACSSFANGGTWWSLSFAFAHRPVGGHYLKKGAL